MSFVQKLKDNKVFKASLGYTLGNYFLKGLSFLTIPLFVRLMSVAEFGFYNIYLSYNEILAIIIGLALHSSLKSAKYDYAEKLDSYLSSIILLPICLMILFLAFGNAFVAWLSPLLGMDQLIINVLIIHSFASAIINIYNAKLSLEYKYKNYLAVSFFNSIGNIGLSLLLMYTILSKDKYEARVIGTAAPLIALSIYIVFSFFKKARPTLNRQFFSYSLKYSLPIIPHGLSQVVLASSDKIMIEKFVGTNEAGLYSIGTNIAAIIRVTTSSLDAAYGPWFYEKAKATKYSTIKKISSLMMIGMSILCGLLMLYSPEIVLLVGGEKYVEAYPAVIPIICAMFFTFLYNFPATVEYYMGKTLSIAISSIIAACLNIGLNMMFIPKYGFVAASYTTLISYMLYFLFHYFAAIKLSRRNFYSWKIVLSLSLLIAMICISSELLINNLIARIILSIVLLLGGLFWFFAYEKMFSIKEGQKEGKKENL